MRTFWRESTVHGLGGIAVALVISVNAYGQGATNGGVAAGIQQQSVQAGANEAITNTLGDSGQDLAFTPVAPCRVLDTRSSVGGILNPGAPQAFFVTGATSDLSSQGGSASGCGIPTGATAVAVNFGATQSAGPGNLRAYAWSPSATAPSAAVVNYGNLAPAGLVTVPNGSIVPICDPGTITCTFDVFLEVFANATHVVADVTGYFKAPANRAYAMVSQSATFVASTTKNFTSVSRPSTGIYCLTPAPGISNAQPAVVTVEWGLSSGFDLLAYNWGFGASGQSGSPCSAGQFHVRTYRFGANPASPALSNNVAFQILVP
jgi:hypothetical protein